MSTVRRQDAEGQIGCDRVEDVIFRMHQYLLQIIKTEDPVGRKAAQPIRGFLYKHKGLGTKSRALVKAEHVDAYEPVRREVEAGGSLGLGQTA